MIVLTGADLVLSGGIQPEGTLVLDGDRIVDIRPEATGLSRRSALGEGFSKQLVESIPGAAAEGPLDRFPPRWQLPQRFPSAGLGDAGTWTEFVT